MQTVFNLRSPLITTEKRINRAFLPASALMLRLHFFSFLNADEIPFHL